MKIYLLFTLFIALWFAPGVHAQPTDGTILSRTLIETSPSAPAHVREVAEAVTCERITYASDGLEVEGYLIIPKGNDGESFPAIIYCRGGNRNFGDLKGDRLLAYKVGKLAREGYVVVATQYRGNGKVGLDLYPGDQTCPLCKQAKGGFGREEFGGREVNDVLSLIPLLESLPEADADRLGIWGHSRGGMMTYLALRESQRFKAAFVGAGVADPRGVIEERPEMEHVLADLVPDWNDAAAREAALDARSAVLWADELPAQTPILILHGTADWRVSPSQALDMSAALLEAKRPFRLMMMEGADHGLSEYSDEYMEALRDWFNHYVRDERTFPSLEPHGG